MIAAASQEIPRTDDLQMLGRGKIIFSLTGFRGKMILLIVILVF
jgi:hypothetical protein